MAAFARFIHGAHDSGLQRVVLKLWSFLPLQSFGPLQHAMARGALARTRTDHDAAPCPRAWLRACPAPDHPRVRRLGSHLAHRGEAPLRSWPLRSWLGAAAAAKAAGGAAGQLSWRLVRQDPVREGRGSRMLAGASGERGSTMLEAGSGIWIRLASVLSLRSFR